MIRKDLISLISASFLFAACEGGPAPAELDHTENKSIGFNGIGFNGIGFNGIGFNGIGFNGIGFNGIGFNGSSWAGMGWNGNGFSNSLISADWGLDSWINNNDADLDGSITAADRELRLSGLAYWTGCACGSSSTLLWTGNNPYPSPHSETLSFPGSLNLAPTWCNGTGPVPVDEQQAVSACLLTRVNVKGIHNILSLRGYDSSLKLVDNEKLFMSYPEGQFFGNLWDSREEIFDPREGNYYPNTKAFACFYPWGDANAQLAKDLQLIIGRSSEWDAGGPMKSTQACLQDGSVDGSMSTGHDGSSAPVYMPDPAVGSSGLNQSSVNGYQDSVTGQQYATWHNNSWRKISAFLGGWADLEVENWKPDAYRCSTECTPVDGCALYKSYGPRDEGGGPGKCETPSECNNCATVVTMAAGPKAGKSIACAKPTDCVRGRKLTALVPGNWLRVMFTRPFDLLTESLVSGVANPHKAGSFLFRYTNGTGGALSIQIKDLIRNTSIDGRNFMPTAGWDDYQNKIIYPIYPGRSTFTGSTPGIDIAIATDPASAAFPHLDYVQMWVGPPFGTPPREQYDDGMTTKAPIPEGGNKTASTFIQIGADGFKSDFAQAHKVRVRVVATGVKLSELRLILIHGKNSVSIAGSSLDSDGWSEWVGNFSSDDPAAGSWEVRANDQVVNGSAGILTGAAVEFQQ